VRWKDLQETGKQLRTSGRTALHQEEVQKQTNKTLSTNLPTLSGRAAQIPQPSTDSIEFLNARRSLPRGNHAAPESDTAHNPLEILALSAAAEIANAQEGLEAPVKGDVDIHDLWQRDRNLLEISESRAFLSDETIFLFHEVTAMCKEIKQWSQSLKLQGAKSAEAAERLESKDLSANGHTKAAMQDPLRTGGDTRQEATLPPGVSERIKEGPAHLRDGKARGEEGAGVLG